MNENWILTKKEMPKENGWYICSAESKVRGELVFVYYFEDGHWMTGSEVIAWMPLPSFYKEKNNDIAEEIIRKFF